MFEKNVGGTDRTLRFVGGAALLVAGVIALLRSSKRNGLGSLLFGAGLLASALTQRCTVNKVLGVDTCPAE